jgi:hypothetical protein
MTIRQADVYAADRNATGKRCLRLGSNAAIRPSTALHRNRISVVYVFLLLSKGKALSNSNRLVGIPVRIMTIGLSTSRRLKAI